MALSEDEVRHIARLARIGMTDADVEKFQRDLSSILDHIARLAEVDTTGVEPTNNGADLFNVMDPDAAQPSAPAHDVLLNAPDQEDGFFRVRAVLE